MKGSTPSREAYAEDGTADVPVRRRGAAYRNRQSGAQFDGVVACGDLALQPFQAGERVGSGPVLIGSPWGDQVGAQVQVLLLSRRGTIRICRLRSAEVSDTGSAPPIFSRQMRV